MLFCVRCGTQNDPTSSFCQKCGQALYKPQAQVPSQTLPPNLTLETQGQLVAPPPPINSDYPSQPVSPPLEYVAPPVSQNYYPQVLPATPYGRPGFTPYPNHPLPTLPDSPVVELHPLAANTRGLPFDLMSHPQRFYSYVNNENRVVFVRRSNFGARLGAGILDLFLMGIISLIISSVIVGSDLVARNTTSATRTTLDSSSGWVFLLSMVIIYSYFFFTGIQNGQSLGKRVVNIRVMKLDGSKPDKTTAALRFICGYMMSSNLIGISLLALLGSLLTSNFVGGSILAILAFGWGFWWCGWDELRQGWHDKIARTLVVDVGGYVEGIHFEKIRQ